MHHTISKRLYNSVITFTDFFTDLFQLFHSDFPPDFSRHFRTPSAASASG
jgi:hypothetical protein